MTTDLDLGLSYEDIAREEARANRPSFRTQPIEWEGDLTAIGKGSETYQDGTEHAKVTFTFKNVKFIDTGGQVGMYTDGQDYILFVDPITPETKNKRLTALGKTTKASGADLPTFVGHRVHVTEVAETYKNGQGYDRQSYHWKFVKVGEAAPAKTTEPTEVGVKLALGLLVDGLTEDAFGLAAMKTPGIGGQPQDAALVKEIASGKFLTAQVAAGKVVKEVTASGDVYRLVG